MVIVMTAVLGVALVLELVAAVLVRRSRRLIAAADARIPPPPDTVPMLAGSYASATIAEESMPALIATPDGWGGHPVQVMQGDYVSYGAPLREYRARKDCRVCLSCYTCHPGHICPLLLDGERARYRREYETGTGHEADTICLSLLRACSCGTGPFWPDATSCRACRLRRWRAVLTGPWYWRLWVRCVVWLVG